MGGGPWGRPVDWPSLRDPGGGQGPRRRSGDGCNEEVSDDAVMTTV